MGHAVRDHGVKTGIQEEDLQAALRGRVPLDRRLNISPNPVEHPLSAFPSPSGQYIGALAPLSSRPEPAAVGLAARTFGVTPPTGLLRVMGTLSGLEAISELLPGSGQGVGPGIRAQSGSLTRPEMARQGGPQQRRPLQPTAAGLSSLPLSPPRLGAGHTAVCDEFLPVPQGSHMAPRYKAPRGTQDILPEVSWRWQRVEAAFRDTCRRYGYSEIRTPIFEEADLFERGTGAGTEIVTKQMYTFEDRGGRRLALRPEGTPSVVRAHLEHGLAAKGVQKFWYSAPIFRYERPQAGRYRQHTQLGVEVLGAPGPDIDAEVIALYHDFLGQIALLGAVAHISSIGCPECRPAMSVALRAFFAPKLADLCGFCQARYESNPLRILDCKVPADVEARQGAPSALDYLCGECQEHFGGVRSQLDALAIPCEVDPTIVRGLDYYTRTAFEVIHPGLGAKDVIMGGGRYDGLAEILGGPPTPGIGFGSGLERLVLALGEDNAPPGPDLYVAAVTAEASEATFALAIEARRAGLSAEVDYTTRSLKAQMKAANRLGAPVVALIGEDELKGGSVTLRDMQTGDQTSVAKAEAIPAVKKILGEPREDSS